MNEEIGIIDVAIATKGRCGLLQRCLLSLEEQTIAKKKIRIFIMDGNEDSSIVQKVAWNSTGFLSVSIFREDEVIPKRKKGRWPILYNCLFLKSQGEFFTYWSDDVFPDHESCFERSVEILEDKSFSSVALRWRDGAGSPYVLYKTDRGNVTLLNFGLIRRIDFSNAGLLDENYHFYHADQDLSIRLARSGRPVFAKEDSVLTVTHLVVEKSVNKYRSDAYQREDMAFLNSKWK